MTRHEAWDEFLTSLYSSAISAHRDSKECEYQKQRQARIDEDLSTNLTAEDKFFVEEILFELGVAGERETEVVYRQGLQDSVWLLKHLGVLA